MSPTWVIFPAADAHRHPRAVAVQRYLAHGVAIANVFRADLGADEWDHGRVTGQNDGVGDDDVDILIRLSGEVVVAYRNP